MTTSRPIESLDGWTESNFSVSSGLIGKVGPQNGTELDNEYFVNENNCGQTEGVLVIYVIFDIVIINLLTL